MTKYLICNNAENLIKGLANYAKTATVEAEYGDAVVPGSWVTLAHHGPRSGNPCPCLTQNLDYGPGPLDAVGLSHVDLDALGGISALLGMKEENGEFWPIAAFIDLHGLHKCTNADQEDLDRLYAVLAYLDANPIYAPRDGSVLDVTEQVENALEVVYEITTRAGRYYELLEVGKAFQKDLEELCSKSYVASVGNVVLRSSDTFVNHLYRRPVAGSPVVGVVGFNTGTGEITVSLAEKVPGLSCRDFMVEHFGPEAGGHEGIAGSPRSGGYSIERARQVAELFAQEIEA